VARWLGHKRDARQEVAGAQPKLGTAYPAKMFAFDGQSQHFVVKADGLEFKEADGTGVCAGEVECGRVSRADFGEQDEVRE